MFPRDGQLVVSVSGRRKKCGGAKPVLGEFEHSSLPLRRVAVRAIQARAARRDRISNRLPELLFSTYKSRASLCSEY